MPSPLRVRVFLSRRTTKESAHSPASWNPTPLRENVLRRYAVLARAPMVTATSLSRKRLSRTSSSYRSVLGALLKPVLKAVRLRTNVLPAYVPRLAKPDTPVSLPAMTLRDTSQTLSLQLTAVSLPMLTTLEVPLGESCTPPPLPGPTRR
jgi:hypothetical protein